MHDYLVISAITEKRISVFLLLFGATMVMLMAGLVFVLPSQIGVLAQLPASVGLIFDAAGSLKTIFIIFLKLIDLALIAVLITIIALTSYQSSVDDIDRRETMDSGASRGIWRLDMMRPQQLKGNLISTVVRLSCIGLLAKHSNLRRPSRMDSGCKRFR